MVVIADRPHFDVEELLVSGVSVVAVHGELDLATVPALAEALARQRAGGLVLDLCDCTFMDSSGLAVVLERSRQTPDSFTVACRGGCSPRRVFEVTGSTRFVSMHESRPAAVAALLSAQPDAA